MKQSTKRFLSMIMGLVLMVGAFVLYFEFIRPAYYETQSIKSRQLSQELFLRNEQSVVDKVKSLISDYQTQASQQEVVSLAFPPREDAGGALAQIYGIARTSGIDMESANISSKVSVGSALRDEAPRDFSVNKPISSTVFNLKMSGSYDDLKSFLSKLESNIRIFDVKRIEIKKSGSATGRSGGILIYDLEVETYHQAE